MEVTEPPSAIELGVDNTYQTIKVKARIKINGDQLPVQSTPPAPRPYQAYCETIASTRSPNPDIFTTPPTHSGPFQPTQTPRVITYTARIVSRRRTASNALSPSSSKAWSPTSTYTLSPTPSNALSPTPSVSHPVQRTTAISPGSPRKGSKKIASTSQILAEMDTISTNRYHVVSQSASPRGSHLKETNGSMSRNHAPSPPQVQQESPPSPTTRVSTARTPVRHKRYGRMEFHALPPLPPSPPKTPVDAKIDQQTFGQTTVNFSRGEIKRKPLHVQEQAASPHLACVDAYTPPPVLPPPDHACFPSATAGHERVESQASKRTVTFADDATISSQNSTSPDPHSYRRHQDQTQPLRQSKSFSPDTQIPSSLRLYRSHDDLSSPASNSANTATQATRRTTPKDHKHQYPFGQRPASSIVPPPIPSELTTRRYNPRLSTSKAQYCGLASLPLPLPSSLRIAPPQTGPRQPPWGSLEDLDLRREMRGDARERDQAAQFRAATLSQATTVGGVATRSVFEGLGEEMRKEVQEYREAVVGVYPDMEFDGSAGKGGRGRCCVVM